MSLTILNAKAQNVLIKGLLRERVAHRDSFTPLQITQQLRECHPGVAFSYGEAQKVVHEYMHDVATYQLALLGSFPSSQYVPIPMTMPRRWLHALRRLGR